MSEKAQTKTQFEEALELLAICIEKTDGIPRDSVTRQTLVSRAAHIEFNRFLRTAVHPSFKVPPALIFLEGYDVDRTLAQFELER